MVKIQLPVISEGLSVDFWLRVYYDSNSTNVGHMQWILQQEVF